ncbi:phosphatase 2C-like domain-containing protein [Dipodascopsis uninucleata]
MLRRFKGVCCRGFTTYYVTPSQSQPGSARLRVALSGVPTHIGHFSSRGNRRENEDRYSLSIVTVPTTTSLTPKSAKVAIGTTRNVFLFSIFDGHGGSFCSEFLAKELPGYIEKSDLSSAEYLENLWKDNVGGYWTRWKGHLERYRGKMDKDSDLCLRVPIAFLQADYDFVIKGQPSGSTATSVMIFGDDSDNTPYWESTRAKVVVAHVGDTRCIICDSDGLAHPLTTVHHPSSPVESSRLRRYAASFFTDSFGEERFGNLANTRSFGDLPMKRYGVSAEPDMSVYTIGARSLPSQFNSKTDFGGDEPFLVLVSDGVSNFVSDQEIADIVTSTGYRSGFMRGTPQEAAREVVQFAEDVGGDDNTTCLVIRLSGWGKWTKPVDRTGELREYRLREALDKVARRQ